MPNQKGKKPARLERRVRVTFFLVAETEAEIGYIIEQSLRNELQKMKVNKPVISILTQVLVNKDDKAFKNPTKFIGPFYNKKQAEKLKRKGMRIQPDPRGGYRRVVASPLPLKILEADVIKKIISNTIVIAAGGGGIPVYKQGDKLKGIEAVIDKDLASSVLASDIKADLFLILTDVSYVYLNFKTKAQQKLKKINLKQAEKYLRQGQFPEGSMGPKIKAAINFLKKNRKSKVIITSPDKIEKALKGKEGTLIIS